jgi:hypothetical protein
LTASALAQTVSAFNDETAGVLIRSRTDIEILADQQFGTGIRVPGWSGSLDIACSARAWWWSTFSAAAMRRGCVFGAAT